MRSVTTDTSGSLRPSLFYSHVWTDRVYAAYESRSSRLTLVQTLFYSISFPRGIHRHQSASDIYLHTFSKSCYVTALPIYVFVLVTAHCLHVSDNISFSLTDQRLRSKGHDASYSSFSHCLSSSHVRHVEGKYHFLRAFSKIVSL